MTVRMLQRRGTASQWNNVGGSLVLEYGELGINLTDNTFKIGDGDTVWNDLEYHYPDNLNEAKYLQLAGGNDISGNQEITGTVTISGDVQLDSDLNIDGQVSSGRIDVNSNKIIGLADPTAQSDAANKKYVDQVAQGLAIKPAVHAATTSNLSGTYTNGTAGVGAQINLGPMATLNIDGETTWLRFDGILVKSQTNAFENGRYYVDQVGSGSVDWILTRCGYCDTADEIASAYVYVQGGATYASTGWVASIGDISLFVVGTSDIDWIQFSGAGTYLAGDGLDIDGNEFSAVGTTGRISVSASGIDIDDEYSGQSSITTLGTVSTGIWEGTEIDVAHGGTGATTAPAALENLGLTATASEINTLDGISTATILEDRLVAIQESIDDISADLENKANTNTDNSMNGDQIIDGIVVALNYDVMVLSEASNEITINFTGGTGIHTRTLTGNATFTGANYRQGSTKTYFITADSTNRTLSFPSGWIWVGTKPTSIAASKTGVLNVTSVGVLEANAVAAWIVQE